MADRSFIPPDQSGKPPVRVDLMSRLGLARPGPARRKTGEASATTPSQRKPRHRVGDK